MKSVRMEAMVSARRSSDKSSMLSLCCVQGGVSNANRSVMEVGVVVVGGLKTADAVMAVACRAMLKDTSLIQAGKVGLLRISE